MTPEMEAASHAIEKPEVQALIKQLSAYGLGVSIPHMHTDAGFAPLPPDMVQLESNLHVDFVKIDDERLLNASTVGWMWDKDKARVVAYCACSGNHFPGSCTPPPR